jgi:Holliday junction resolvase-like predicted endonuclease
VNFLEQLTAEWYAFNGYFVQTNLKFGKRNAGGWEGEIDVVAFHPLKKVLVHVEASTDADSWIERKEKFTRKFHNAQEYYPELFQFDYKHVYRIAIVGSGRTHPSDISLEGINIKTIPEFVSEITVVLAERNVAKQTVPEHWPLLRAIQLAIAYGVRDTNR